MKKALLYSLIITCILTSIFLIVNIITTFAMSRPIISIKFDSGEIVQFTGFGITHSTFHPLYSVDNPQTSYTEINFDLFSLFISFVLVFIIVFLLSLIIKKIKTKKD